MAHTEPIEITLENKFDNIYPDLREQVPYNQRIAELEEKVEYLADNIQGLLEVLFGTTEDKCGCGGNCNCGNSQEMPDGGG